MVHRLSWTHVIKMDYRKYKTDVYHKCSNNPHRLFSQAYIVRVLDVAFVKTPPYLRELRTFGQGSHLSRNCPL